MDKNLTHDPETTTAAGDSSTTSARNTSSKEPSNCSTQSTLLPDEGQAAATTEEVIEFPSPLDVPLALRLYQLPEGDRCPFSISSCPRYLVWGAEDLSNRASASHAKTCAFLLDEGIRRLWAFPGARDLQRARETIVRHGDPAAFRWIDTWEFDVPTADTGETTKKERVPLTGILDPLGRLATVLGFTKSKTAVLALAVTLLEDAGTPIRYHNAQVDLLLDFAATLRTRAEEAFRVASQSAGALASDSALCRRSLADIIGVRA